MTELEEFEFRLRLEQEQAGSSKPVEQPAEAPSGFLRGLKDPIDAGAQMLTSALPAPVVQAGNRLNNWLADTTGIVDRLPEGGVDQQVREENAAYEQARTAAGETGMDWARLGGNLAATAIPGAVGTRAAAAMLPKNPLAVGALTGAALGTAQPVTEGEVGREKVKQAMLGGLFGMGGTAAGNSVARLISPKASVNPDVQKLIQAGVRPTMGQVMGGMPNRVEQKLTSLPLFGDSISAARQRASEQFNRATLNEVVASIGGKVDEVGEAGIKSAGNQISRAYDEAAKLVKGVRFDRQFQSELANLKQLATGLTPDMQRKFQGVLNNEFAHRLSPAKGMTPETFKVADSAIGAAARRFSKSSMASEQELGDALLELQRIIRAQAGRTNPAYGAALKKADAAWAKLVRVESAGKSATKRAGSDGTFTPRDLLAGISSNDSSVRGRAVARGDALMQEWAGAGNRVLGNTVPDSGTAGRLAAGVGVLPFGIADPASAALVLGGGAAAYLSPAQRVAVALLAQRPQAAQRLAGQVRVASPYLAIPGVALGDELMDGR